MPRRHHKSASGEGPARRSDGDAPQPEAPHHSGAQVRAAVFHAPPPNDDSKEPQDPPSLGRATRIAPAPQETTTRLKELTKAALAARFNALYKEADEILAARQQRLLKDSKSSARQTNFIQQFLDGRFRLCMCKAIEHVFTSRGRQSEAEWQHEMAELLGVTYTAMGYYRDGSRLMSTSVWDWFCIRMHSQLKDFQAPSLEQRQVAGYVEAMACAQDDMLGPIREPSARRDIPGLPAPKAFSFYLLRTALGTTAGTPVTAIDNKGKENRQLRITGVECHAGSLESLYRLLQSREPTVLPRGVKGDAAELKAYLAEAFKDWGLAYAKAIPPITAWLKEIENVD